MLKSIEKNYWDSFKESIGEDLSEVRVSASIAGNYEIADELLGLYISGKKSAGSSLLKDYVVNNEDLPQMGGYWIILNSKDEPKCIVKTIRVEQYQFSEVPEEVAIKEGEGDLSLAYWRQAHIEFFSPFLKDWGIEELDKETLITEFFEVVYKS